MHVFYRYLVPLAGLYVGLQVGLGAYWKWFMGQEWSYISVHNVGYFLHKNVFVGAILGLALGDALAQAANRRARDRWFDQRAAWLKQQLGRADLPEDQRVAIAALLHDLELNSRAEPNQPQ